MAVPKLLVTIEKWYELVIRLDHQWRQAVAEQKVFAPTNSQPAQQTWSTPANQQSQPQQWGPPVQPTPRDPNAMQVDRNCGPL
ncbi:hypothetical protein AMATHDRAFT_162977 [Amanita thiersii Skay4041]|uniref:Uncharacterized protein n=1 Tax=Amanita thiersii Skay4041 TaxID=703135 RepID=A0A2A9NBW1_9AGAR|nr:hypothetical protein AMATHDRAFT_162977 [Amanita thiersii Skay4041]